MKKWFVYNKKADFQGIAERFGIDQVTARILRNREINSDPQIENFLNGTMEALHSPLLLPDAIRCMNQLDRAINEHQKIRVVGDYDVDGVCASVILLKTLRRLNADVSCEIPDRIKDGYGINRRIIDDARADGVNLILTCDNGISARDELMYARELGITVLVTDHHDVPQRTDEDYGCESRDILPPAAAVVDAKRESSRYPFSEICGAVVALKIMELLLQKRLRPKEDLDGLLEFAALATICDVVKLQDENRIIVKYGLEQIRNTKNIGLRALLEVTGISEKEKLNTYHVGFVLGPCINAAGRLQNARLALKLFMADTREEALPIAAELKDLNDSRKEMTENAAKRAYDLVERQYAYDPVLVIYIPDLHESLAGIVAGRLKERYYRPSYVLTDAAPAADGTPMAKGSGRSIEAYPMSEKLSEVSSLLEKYGGHPMAAGFSLKRGNIEAFRKALNEHAALKEEDLQEKLWIDVPMPLDYISEELIHDFEKLEPFGTGNERPLFATKGLTITGMRVLGRNQNVVRLDLRTPNGKLLPGILFTDGAAFRQSLGGRSHITIAYYPEINEYNGTKTIQAVIEDYRLEP